MSAFKYFTKIDIAYRDIVKHVKASGGLLSECSVDYCQSAAKTTEVEARVALVCASTDDGRPLTGGANLIWTVVDYSETSGVKLIPCMYSHVSSPGRSVSGQGHAY